MLARLSDFPKHIATVCYLDSLTLHSIIMTHFILLHLFYMFCMQHKEAICQWLSFNLETKDSEVTTGQAEILNNPIMPI